MTAVTAKPAKEFMDDLWESFMPLHKVAEIQTKQFFAAKPSKKELENFFHIRLSNERMNMIELSKKVSELPALTDPEECRLLSKQAWDEAEHFRIVYEVLEHLTGEKPDLEKIWATYGKVDVRMGASLVQKYEAHENPIMMHLYQYMAEGRAASVWQTMAKVAGDEFIQKRYDRVARDEKFHSNIGRLMLEKLVTTPEAQAECMSYVKEMVWDLFECSCTSLGDFKTASPEVQQIMLEAYGEPHRDLCVAFNGKEAATANPNQL
jgi:rubrerythrin